jgi:hypothetical protein
MEKSRRCLLQHIPLFSSSTTRSFYKLSTGGGIIHIAAKSKWQIIFYVFRFAANLANVSFFEVNEWKGNVKEEERLYVLSDSGTIERLLRRTLVRLRIPLNLFQFSLLYSVGEVATSATLPPKG